MKTFAIRPYPAQLHFTKDRAEFLAFRSKHITDDFTLDNTAGCASNFNDQTIQLVGVFDDKVSTLAHELSHVCFKVLESCGIATDDDNSEVFCYLLGDLIDECLKD